MDSYNDPAESVFEEEQIARNALQRSLLTCRINLPADIEYIKYNNNKKNKEER